MTIQPSDDHFGISMRRIGILISANNAENSELNLRIKNYHRTLPEPFLQTDVENKPAITAKCAEKMEHNRRRICEEYEEIINLGKGRKENATANTTESG